MVLMAAAEQRSSKLKAARKAIDRHALIAIPRQTWWDKYRAWESINKQMPEAWQSEPNEWKKLMKQVTTRKEAFQLDTRWQEEMPTTKQTYELRRQLSGLVIGPLDKNNGELWACCPVLYREILQKMYGTETGYEELHIAKMSQHRVLVSEKGTQLSDPPSVWDRFGRQVYPMLKADATSEDVWKFSYDLHRRVPKPGGGGPRWPSLHSFKDYFHKGDGRISYSMKVFAETRAGL